MTGLRRGQTVAVRVERVVDGDTVRVRKSGFWSFIMPGGPIVVRLYGIDAPESQQRYGKQSTTALRKFLRGRGKLMLEACDTDRYGRTVGLLYRNRRGREQSANLRMVQEGWAYAFTRYGGNELGFQQAEDEAKQRRCGVWASKTNRMGKDRPWDYRAGERQAERRRIKVRMALALLGLVVLGAGGVWMWNAGW